MHIKELSIKNFRNYEALDLEFSPGINFIIGENGTGKTNILEAISIASNIKSFRNIGDSEIIKWGNDSFYCSTTTEESEYRKFEIGCTYQDSKIKKKIKIDGKEIKRASKYFGKFLTVIFSPIDINIINGAPELRRKFFDSAVSKVDFDYITVLSEFKKVLTSRNKLLKMLKERRTNDYSQLEIWDRMFAEKASILITKRLEFLERFSVIFKSTYSGIARDDPEHIIPAIEYSLSTEATGIEQIVDLLLKRREKEIIIGSTGVGPQRDDYIFKNSMNNDFVNYASQGQRRTAAIALKMSENEIIEEKRGEKTVILVDDIFSELDEKRRKNMIDILRRGNQVIFTMVHSNSVNLNDFGSHKTFTVEAGGVITEQDETLEP
ncbi:MAG: DNA replication/repair protein RecF [bacterium]|nr:DNA replication/repair protein RecF [bacterium]